MSLNDIAKGLNYVLSTISFRRILVLSASGRLIILRNFSWLGIEPCLPKILIFQIYDVVLCHVSS